MYGRNTIFTRENQPSNQPTNSNNTFNGQTNPINYSQFSRDNQYHSNSNIKFGSFRLEYRYGEPPSEIISCVPQWREYPPISIVSRSETLHLSLTQFRVEDYYLIRSNKLSDVQSGRLKQAIKKQCFNEQLLKCNSHKLPPISHEQPIDINALRYSQNSNNLASRNNMSNGNDGNQLNNNIFISNNNGSSTNSFMRNSMTNNSSNFLNANQQNNSSNPNNSNQIMLAVKNNSNGQNIFNSSQNSSNANNSINNFKNNIGQAQNIFTSSHNQNGGTPNTSNIMNRNSNGANNMINHISDPNTLNMFSRNGGNNGGGNNGLKINSNSSNQISILNNGGQKNNNFMANINNNSSSSNIFSNGNNNNMNSYGNNSNYSGNNHSSNGNCNYGNNNSGNIRNTSNLYHTNSRGNQLFHNNQFNSNNSNQNNKNYANSNYNQSMFNQNSNLFNCYDINQAQMSLFVQQQRVIDTLLGKINEDKSQVQYQPLMQRQSIFQQAERHSFDNYPEIDSRIKQKQEKKVMYVYIEQKKKDSIIANKKQKQISQSFFSNATKINQPFQEQYGSMISSKYSINQQIKNQDLEDHTLHIQAKIIWIGFSQSTQKIIKKEIRLSQNETSIDSYSQKCILESLRGEKIIRSDAVLKIHKRQSKGTTIFLDCFINQKLINIDPKYKVQYEKVRQNYDIQKLQISSKFGRVEWLGPINVMNIDFATNGFAIGENEITCDIQQLNTSCQVTFYTLPKMLQKYFNDQKKARQKLAKIVQKNSNGKFELIQMSIQPPQWRIKASKFFDT